MNPNAPLRLQAVRRRLTVKETRNFLVLLEPSESRLGLVHMVVLPRESSEFTRSLKLLCHALKESSGGLAQELEECMAWATRAACLVQGACDIIRVEAPKPCPLQQLQELYGRKAGARGAEPSIVFRCGFFRTQFCRTFDLPAAFHIISADLLGQGAVNSVTVCWNAVFHPDHFLSLPSAVAAAGGGPAPNAVGNEDILFLAELRRKLNVWTHAACPLCRQEFSELAELVAHWRRKCLKALSVAAAGEPVCF